jgi:HlyD family secretion protein
MRSRLLASASFLLIGCGVAAYVWLPRVIRRPEATAPSWASPELRHLELTVTTSGTVRLKTGAAVRVGSQVSGIVKTLHVTVGRRIQQGDVIAEIDPRPLEARLTQARTQVAIDEVALEKPVRDLARSQRLLASQLVAAQETEDFAWQVKAAQAKLDNSRSNLAAAEVDLAYAVIRAPISGIIASVSTQEGETVAATFAAPTFVTIVDARALELVAMVDETDIANVRPGQPVVFTVQAVPSRDLNATVMRVDPTATIISGVVNYPVVASITKAAPFLKPDMTASVSIRTAVYQGLVVPMSSVHGDESDRYVYILKNGTPARQPVTIGLRDARFTEITNGLSVRDRVIVDAPTSAGKTD